MGNMCLGHIHRDQSSDSFGKFWFPRGVAVGKSSCYMVCCQELHVWEAEEDNADPWEPYYTQALGRALSELTLLTSLRLEFCGGRLR